MNNYVVYMHIKGSDGEPFYIGKGRPTRPTETYDRSKLWCNITRKYGRVAKVLYTGLSDNSAKAIEIFWIAVYGRRDNNTGILVNHTNGGDGSSGFIMSNQHKAAILKANLVS